MNKDMYGIQKEKKTTPFLAIDMIRYNGGGRGTAEKIFKIIKRYR
jgi:hypothetical protein